MTQTEIKDTAARIAAATMPSQAGFGLVYETWQRAWDNAMRAAVTAEVPEAQREAVTAELIASGSMSNPDEPSVLDEPGTCGCGLDEMTCPSGCFEREFDSDFDWGDDVRLEAQCDEEEYA